MKSTNFKGIILILISLSFTTINGIRINKRSNETHIMQLKLTNTTSAIAEEKPLPTIKVKEPKYENVKYVTQISAAGKAALELQESGDIEYQKLLNAGFESPTFNSKVIENQPTKVSTPANVNFLWQGRNPRDANLWTNVEYNVYNNRLLDTQRYSTPAHYTMNEAGNTVVHAPSDQGLHIITPAATIITSNNSAI